MDMSKMTPPAGPFPGRPGLAEQQDVLELRTLDRLDLRTIWYALRRQLDVILICVAVLVALSMVFTAMQPRTYSATARVALNKGTEVLVPRKDETLDTNPPSSDTVDTEVEVVRSRGLAYKVALAAGLDRDQAFNPLLHPHEGLLHRIARNIGLAGPPPAGVAPGSPPAQDAAVDALLGSLSVQRVGSTYTIDIGITSTDPQAARKIANAYAEQYTLLYLEQTRASGTHAASFLSKRLEELRDQAQADTARAQQYRIANNLMSTSGASLTEQEISSYNEQVAAARAQAEEDIARLQTARSQLRAGSTGDDVGEALNSPVVTSLRSQRSEVSGRLAALETQFGPLYPPVQTARKQLEDIDAQIAAEIKRIISNLEAKVKVSSERLGSIEGSLGAARGQLASNNRAMVGLDDLTRRAEASQQLYNSYLTQYKEIVAGQGTERPESRVISYADVPSAPVSPKPMLNLLLSLVIGAGLGVVIGLVREMMYAALTTASDVETRLGVRGLGSIPQLQSILPDEVSPVAAVIGHPGSGFTEAFRGLRTAISYAVPDRHQVLMLTSALPREGKTTTSACLATVAAMAGDSVVLIDADLRQRGTSRMVPREPNRPGLLETLRGQATLDEALVQSPLSRAAVLPIRGAIGDVEHMWHSDAVDRLIEELRRRYAVVIFDACPLLPVTDARVLATKVDAVVMVTRWRATPDHAVRAALRLLPDVTPIAGIALSQVDIEKQARFGYGDDGLYYHKYKNYYI